MVPSGVELVAGSTRTTENTPSAGQVLARRLDLRRAELLAVVQQQAAADEVLVHRLQAGDAGSGRCRHAGLRCRRNVTSSRCSAGCRSTGGRSTFASGWPASRIAVSSRCCAASTSAATAGAPAQAELVARLRAAPRPRCVTRPRWNSGPGSKLARPATGGSAGACCSRSGRSAGPSGLPAIVTVTLPRSSRSCSARSGTGRHRHAPG